MTLISIIKQQQLLIYSTQFKLQTQRWMGNFIRENTAKRETAGREKRVIPIEIQPSWEFLVALYQTHHQGAVLTNTRCICWQFLVSKQFPFISAPRLQDPGGSKGDLGTAPGWTQGHQKGQGEGGEQVIPTPAWNHPTAPSGAPGHKLCVPRDRSSSVSRWGLAFSSFYSCPRN